MTVATLTTLVHDLTNTNSTTFADASILTELNRRYGQRILDILHCSVDVNASIKEVTTSLVSTSGLTVGDLGYRGEYPFPTDLLRPVRADISFDGTSWYTADIYDLNDNGTSEVTEDSINSVFSQSEPAVRFEHDSYFVRPVKDTTGDITGGIHLWYEKRQTDLTTGSPDFEANLHDILAYDVSKLEFIKHADKYSANVINNFYTDFREVEKRFFQFYKDRFRRNMKFSLDFGSSNNSYK